MLLVCAGTARAGEPTVHARIAELFRDFQVNADLTYTETITVDTQVVTEHGIQQGERSALTFYPKNQRLEVVEAWVDEPDGTRLPVPDAARFTRPSPAAQSAPGFTAAQTTTLVYPQVRPGSRTHVVWRLTQTTPALLGFNTEAEIPLDTPVGEERVRIVAPAGLPIQWRERGGFAVTDTTDSGRRTIDARIADTHAEDSERNMVDSEDFAPLFVATSLPNLQALGAIYARQSRDKILVTPDIAALARTIAGGRTGLPAARAVYDWVAGNIRYVAVYLDPNDGWVPHAAADVLKNGYGDCKDHVVLMQALLAALDIRAIPALIDQGTRTTDLPLAVPQFNHVVAWLPDFHAFANPTNPYARFDSLDRLLADKTVVLATEAGEVAKTPPQRPADNKYRMDSRIEIAPDGTIAGQATIVPAANLEAAARSAITQQSSPRDIAERVLSGTPEGGFGTFVTSDPRDLSAPFTLHASWHSPRGVTFDGREAWLTVPVGPDLGPPSRLRALLSDDGPRRHPLLTGAGESEWNYTIALPPGLVVARLPHDVTFENSAGTYTAHYERTGADVAVARHLVIAHGLFAASEYDDLQALIYAAVEDTRAVLGLAREQAER
jgi:transglutaminase-like putative cysteine protease